MDRPCILIVEDDQELLEIMRIRIGSRGYRIVVTGSGGQCLALAQKFEPHCIILDVFLPDVDGLTVLRRLKAPLDVETGRPLPTKDIPVIVVTGKAPMIENMTRIEGASDFFLKPIDIEKLTERVTQLVEQREYERTHKCESKNNPAC